MSAYGEIICNIIQLYFPYSPLHTLATSQVEVGGGGRGC